MKVIKRAIVIGFGVLALAGSGCGAGSGGDAGGGGAGGAALSSSEVAESVTTASISKAAFVKQADAICEKREKQIQADFLVYAKENKDVKEPTEADYTALIDAVLAPNIEKEVEEIEQLGAPAGDEDEVGEILAARIEGLNHVESSPKTVIDSNEDIFAEASKLAKAYGLKSCGS